MAAKLLLATVLVAGVLALLWFVVFPAMEQQLPFNDVTVNPGADATTAP